MARCKNAPETSCRTTPTLQIRYFEDDDAKARHQALKGRQTLAEKVFVFKGPSKEGFPPNVMATIAMHKWEKFVTHHGSVEPDQKSINVTLVQEFYAHLTSQTQSSVFVRGEHIHFTAAKINKFYGLQNTADNHSKFKGVFESPEDLQKKGRLGITAENIPSLMGFDETTPAKQPMGGARTVAAAKLAALTTMAETTRDQLEGLRTDLRTYFNYVQERDQPQEKPLGSDSASSSPTPPDATPQHQSPPTQRRKGKEPANTPTIIAEEIDSEETTTLEEEELQRTPTPPVATTHVRRRTKRTAQHVLVEDSEEEVQSGAGEEDQPMIIPPTHPTSIKRKATKRARRATTKPKDHVQDKATNCPARASNQSPAEIPAEAGLDEKYKVEEHVKLRPRRLPKLDLKPMRKEDDLEYKQQLLEAYFY
ncbi:hypothetical protein GQ457_02G024110 [Hibiscus cannabinus]